MIDRRGELAKLPGLRAKMTRQAACPWDDHEWVRFYDPTEKDMVIYILCWKCGRLPAEALVALPIVL